MKVKESVIIGILKENLLGTIIKEKEISYNANCILNRENIEEKLVNMFSLRGAQIEALFKLNKLINRLV